MREATSAILAEARSQAHAAEEEAESRAQAARVAASEAEAAATVPEDTVDLAPVAADQQIADRILEILSATNWFTDLTISVDEGVVFLDGQATTDGHRAWAQDVARKITGAIAVVNNIDVVTDVNWSFDPALAELEKLACSNIRGPAPSS